MSERTLIDWLVNRKYEYFHDFPFGGKFPDLIAIKDNEITAFEFKKRVIELPKAIGQCLYYLNEANKVFIVIPDKEKSFLSKFTFETLKRHGIGLITSDHEIKILIKAKKILRDNTLLLEEIKKRKIVIKEGIKEKSDIKEQVIKILKDHPEGLALSIIAKYGNISRPTASKYLAVLEAKGIVECRNIGMAKVFKIKDG